MAARRGKNVHGELQVSLIPVIERQEEQLRKDLDQARHQAENRIRGARERASQHIQQGRQRVSELIEQTRQQRLCEMHAQAEQIVRSSEQHRVLLRQRIEKNMPEAVVRVVDAVIRQPARGGIRRD